MKDPQLRRFKRRTSGTSPDDVSCTKNGNDTVFDGDLKVKSATSMSPSHDSNEDKSKSDTVPKTQVTSDIQDRDLKRRRVGDTGEATPIHKSTNGKDISSKALSVAHGSNGVLAHKMNEIHDKYKPMLPKNGFKLNGDASHSLALKYFSNFQVMPDGRPSSPPPSSTFASQVACPQTLLGSSPCLPSKQKRDKHDFKEASIPLMDGAIRMNGALGSITGEDTVQSGKGEVHSAMSLASFPLGTGKNMRAEPLPSLDTTAPSLPDQPSHVTDLKDLVGLSPSSDTESDSSSCASSDSDPGGNEPFTAARLMALNRIQAQQRREQFYRLEGFRPPPDSEYQSGDSIDSTVAEDSGGSDSSSSDLAD